MATSDAPAEVGGMPCHQAPETSTGADQFAHQGRVCPHCADEGISLGCDCCDVPISLTPVSPQRTFSVVFVCIDIREPLNALPRISHFPDGPYRPPQLRLI